MALKPTKPLPPPVALTPEELDHLPLTFGKYSGRTPDDIANDDPSYIVWMFDNVSNFPTCSKALRDACEADVRENEAEGDFDGRFDRDFDEF